MESESTWLLLFSDIFHRNAWLFGVSNCVRIFYSPHNGEVTWNIPLMQIELLPFLLCLVDGSRKWISMTRLAIFYFFFSAQRLEVSLFWIIIFKQCFLFYWFMNEKLHNFQSSVWGAPFKPIPPDKEKKKFLTCNL